jgi:hypothetical protein
MSYPVQTVEVGHTQRYPLHCVVMPRSEFVDIVQEAIEVAESQHDVTLPDDLLETAKTMESFPLDAWIVKTRGCGCVVGEYLIAHDALQRDDGVGQVFTYFRDRARDSKLAALWDVGVRVDGDVSRAVNEDAEDEHDGVVIFEEDL